MRRPAPLRKRVLVRQHQLARARADARAARDALGAVALAAVALLACAVVAGGGALLALARPAEEPPATAGFAFPVARPLRALLGRRRAGDNCGAAARPLAVLIAGGGRPDPQQPAGPLVAPADPACPPAVDVFVALAEGEGGGADDADDAELRRWFQVRGARAVHVERVAAPALADLRRDLALASSAAGRSVEPPPQVTAELYLRHRAFAAAAAAGRAAGRAYAGFAYWRADSVFLRPPPEALVPAAGTAPAAVVDWPCGPAAEARSGRAVLADPAAAAALFAGGDGVVSPREHVLRQARRFADFPRWSYGPTAFGFAAAELRAAGATVTRADLRRADAEYAGGRLCVPDRQLCGDRRGDRAVVRCSAVVAAARDAAARDAVFEAGREVEGGFF